MREILIAAALAVVYAWIVRRSFRAVHMLQLDSYANGRLARWLLDGIRQRFLVLPVAALLLGLIAVCLALAPVFGSEPAALIALGAWIAGGAALFLTHRPPPAKKPLVYTGRALRILGVALGLDALVAAGVGLAAIRAGDVTQAAGVTLTAGLLLTQLAPLGVIVANVLLAPVQAAINASYVRAARRRLSEVRPVVIGITGSYGKTSTKYAVATILREKLDVLMTPHSYNTLMGVTRTINEELRSGHAVFVVEMGAYRPGDIRELTDLVRPTIGILTAIGPQHLERFGSLERIEATKYELIEGLPGDGLAVFNADDPRCARLADRTTARRVARYGVAAPLAGLRVHAEHLTMGPDGLDFALVTDDGQRTEAHTRLLGRHNVSNILAAATVALELGLDLSQIVSGIARLEAVPHRLQRIQGAEGVTVIDDSYNSNVVGALEALEVLRSFGTGRRVLVTPGMVELGTLEAEYNERFGARAAEVCDRVILVGQQQTAAIRRGLQRANFPADRLRVVPGLSEATAALREVLRPGDVVLFENDLPDLYIDRA